MAFGLYGLWALWPLGFMAFGLYGLGVACGRRDIAQLHYTPEHALFRRLLREARVKAGLRQEQLGERIGLSQLSVSRCENGDRKIDVLELRAMCREIGVPFVEFMAQLDQSLNELEHATQSRKPPPTQTILLSEEVLPAVTPVVPARERTRRSGPRVRSPRKPH